MIGINVGIIIILVAFTAFFVSSEFAMVKVRTTRIDQLVAEGNKKAEKAKKILSNLDGYLSATQVGITITSLILGWLGEPTVRVLLRPIFDWIQLPFSIKQIISFIIAFAVITFFNVVVGELAPKTFAIQKRNKSSYCLHLLLFCFIN